MASPRPLALALLSFVVACKEPEPCPVEVDPVLLLGDGEGSVCTVTPTGLVLRSPGFGLVLERLTEQGTVEELISIQTESWHCGTVAEDPERNTIWLTVPGSDFVSDAVAPAHRLLKLDADGQMLSEETLVHEGEPVYIASSVMRAGELYLAGSVHVANPDDWNGLTALLERRDANGTLVWRQIAYAGFNPQGDSELRDFDELESIVGIDEGFLAVFGRVQGTDSSSFSMMTLRDETGDVYWTNVVDVDTYFGGYPQLGSDNGHTILVSEDRQQLYAFDEETYEQLGLLRAARSIVTAYNPSGYTHWRGEVEWAEIDDLRVTEAVSEADSFFHVVSGSDVDDAALRHVSLARQDWKGALDCTASLDDLGLWSVTSLYQLDDGRVVLVGGVEIPQDNPEPGETPPLQPAIVLLDVEPGPSPY